MQVEALHKLLPEHTALVVECLARITDSMDQEAYIHIPVDESRKILKAGLNAENTEIQENAERARENLLRSRRFEFMDF